MEGWRQKQLGVQGIAFRLEGDELVHNYTKNGLTPTGLLMEGQCAHRAIQMDLCLRQVNVKPAFLQPRTLIGKWTQGRLYRHVARFPMSVSALAILHQVTGAKTSLNLRPCRQIKLFQRLFRKDAQRHRLDWPFWNTATTLAAELFVPEGSPKHRLYPARRSAPERVGWEHLKLSKCQHNQPNCSSCPRFPIPMACWMSDSAILSSTDTSRLTLLHEIAFSETKS